MCGFLGIGGKSFYENKISEIIKAFEWLKHRGPDESNFQEIGEFFIGFHRLAIVGLNSKESSQPIHLIGIRAYLSPNKSPPNLR